MHVFGNGESFLPVHLVASGGEEVALRTARIHVENPAVVEVRDSTVRCLALGLTRLHVRWRGKAVAMDLGCRPMPRQVLPNSSLTLDVTDEPRAFRYYAQWENGKYERIIPVRVDSIDTGVVRIDGDSLRAVGVGRTKLAIDFGGIRVLQYVQVTERLAQDTVPYTPRAFRRWDLADGLYALTVKRSPPRLGATGYEIITEGARCARATDDENTVFCSVKDTGSVSVYSVATDRRRAREYATVDLWRLPR